MNRQRMLKLPRMTLRKMPQRISREMIACCT